MIFVDFYFFIVLWDETDNVFHVNVWNSIFLGTRSFWLHLGCFVLGLELQQVGLDLGLNLGNVEIFVVLEDGVIKVQIYFAVVSEQDLYVFEIRSKNIWNHVQIVEVAH